MAIKDVAQKLATFYQALEAEKIDKEHFYIKDRLEEKIHRIKKVIAPLEAEGEHSEKEAQCLGEILQGLNKLSTLASKLEEQFTIFVIGDGNVGKSTVVNSLLGEEMAKMKFDPMTWKVDVFHNGKVKDVQVVRFNPKGNQEVYMPLEEAIKLIDEEEQKRDISIRKIQDRIKEKTETIQKVCKAQKIPYRQVADKLEAFKERLWQEELYTSDIIEVKWPVETAKLLRNFQIVDTPGLRQNRLGSHLKESIKKYYDEADGIIWVMDMNKIAMDSTKTYIEEIEEALVTKTKACKEKQMVALLNRSDCIKSEADKQAVIQQAHTMYQETFNAIFPFSATLALKGRLEQDAILLKESGYKALEDYIKNHFLKGASEARTNKLLKEIQREEIKFQLVVNYYIQELEEKHQEHIEGQKQLVRLFRQLTEETLSQLESFSLSYMRRVVGQIEKLAENLFEIRGDKHHYIKEELFKLEEQEQELKALLEVLERKVGRIRQQQLDKLGLREIAVQPVRKLLQSVTLKAYEHVFDDVDFEFEQLEEHFIRKMVTTISTVKKIVDRPHIKVCKEKLLQVLNQLVEVMMQDLTQTLENCLVEERSQILEIKRQQFNNHYGNDEKWINQLYSLKIIEEILSETARESTVMDYIKGTGDKNGTIY